ncbi:MAG: type II secretion system protein [Sedimentisphaerales bacterium]|nr:type II secretion system protein [Sedimentisphaerales bacterium]
MIRVGHTLVECITVVLILSILALVAVPRLPLGAVWGARTDATIRQLATDLRRTRMQAIAEAVGKPAGFALVMTGASPYRSYQIVDLEDSAAVADRDIAPDVQCTGGQRFEFGPLGNLKEGSDTQLRISSERRAYQLQITPATGTVRWFPEE